MSTSPAQSLPSGSSGPGRVSVVAGIALACALAPVLPLLSIVSTWSALFLAGPYVALVLAVATLVATHRREAGHARLMAWLAIAVTIGWVLMLIALGLALLSA